MNGEIYDSKEKKDKDSNKEGETNSEKSKLRPASVYFKGRLFITFIYCVFLIVSIVFRVSGINTTIAISEDTKELSHVLLSIVGAVAQKWLCVLSILGCAYTWVEKDKKGIRICFIFVSVVFLMQLIYMFY